MSEPISYNNEKINTVVTEINTVIEREVVHVVTENPNLTINSSTKLGSDALKTSTDQTLNFPSEGGTVATLAGTETLTNKTLTSPTIDAPTLTLNSANTITTSNSKTITFPSADNATLATIEDLGAQTSYTWNTTNGINADVFDAASNITLTCMGKMRHINGYLVSRAKDDNEEDITFSPGAAVVVLPAAKFSTNVTRFTDGLPGSWLVEFDDNGISIASSAMVDLTGAHTLTFSFTWMTIAPERETIAA